MDGALPDRVPALTILMHADIDRIGDRARMVSLLAGRAVDLSRASPLFSAPRGRAAARPLDDRYVSRKRPIRIRRDKGGAILLERGSDGMRLVVDGREVGSSVTIPLSTLERPGAVLVLNDRVVLLLHLLGASAGAGETLGLVGESEAIVAVSEDIQRYADLDIPVLIRGESGTGKELVANAIHAESPRSARPCLSVNMAAVQASTAASELFGHARGAFTGANRDHRGYFERANGGTLFLDEIAETPAEVQPMLLRVLESGEIQPVGAPAFRRVDVRLVAATDADLEARTGDGRFRTPLLHRLAGFEIRLPPLRDRKDDIARLLVHFLRADLAELGEAALLEREGKPPLDPDVAARLFQFDWPGNVRQLRNASRQIAVASRGASCLQLGRALTRTLAEPATEPAAPTEVEAVPRRRPADITEAELIEALSAHGWRLMPTARALGISRTSIYTLVDRCDGIRKASDVPMAELRAAYDAHDGQVAKMAAALEVSPRGLKLRLPSLKKG